jgi:N-acetylglucosaminyl-diphospho-decaprenol L-rhamnosyltransferase
MLSPAWNQGAKETTAPWLLFLNPDTEWRAGTLADLVNAGKRHPRAGIIGPSIRNPDGSLYTTGRAFPSVFDAVGHALLSPFTRRNPFSRRYEMANWDRTTERTVDWVSGACMLMPRAAFNDVGGFDEAFPFYAEELDVATRMHTRGWKVVFTPDVEVMHVIGVSSGRSRAMLLLHSRSVYHYYKVHRAHGWRRLTLPIALAVLRLRAEIAWVRTKVATG